MYSCDMSITQQKKENNNNSKTDCNNQVPSFTNEESICLCLSQDTSLTKDFLKRSSFIIVQNLQEKGNLMINKLRNYI